MQDASVAAGGGVAAKDGKKKLGGTKAPARSTSQKDTPVKSIAADAKPPTPPLTQAADDDNDETSMSSRSSNAGNSPLHSSSHRVEKHVVLS